MSDSTTLPLRRERKAGIYRTDHSIEGTVQTDRRVAGAKKPRRQPRYQVILWDDDDHSYDYVIRMMHHVFGHPRPTGLQIAEQVDTLGRAVCLTTTREHAELKRDQIHAYGKDQLVAGCAGSMYSTIAPIDS